VVGDHVLNSTVDRKTISDFTATWRLQDGITQWSYLWSPNNTNMAFDVQHTAFMSRDNPNGGAVELQVTPRGGNYNASIIDLLDGRSAQRSRLVEKGMLAETQIFVGVHPEGLPNVTAFIVSTAEVSNGYTVESSRRMVTTTGYKNENNMTIGQEWDVQLIDGETAVFQKFIGVASSDKFEQPRVCATASSTTSAQNGWDATISEHTHAWNNLMKRNLITDYRDPSTGKLPVNDRNIQNLRIEAVIDRYITLINLLPENGSGLNDVGISPTGMSADSYGGMVFWDQDQWIAPNIAAMNPEYAVQILNSRVKFWEQAKTNTQMDYVKQNYTFDHNSVLYPWTSGRYGNATATGPALNYQYHLNTDIALSMLQFLRITGNESHFQQKFWPVIKSVGHTIATLLQKDGNGWSILNLTDPDEYAVSPIPPVSI
jgi:trehalose/maltose hydrolase-like predicted phosphorylase